MENRPTLVFADGACSGNPGPGGWGTLIVTPDGLVTELGGHEPDTTNNRMALRSALEALGHLKRRCRVLFVSDSQYLVKGMSEWVRGWKARGWTRKQGPIENLELWKALVASSRLHEVQWTWVRGHRGHPKNEYANDLAVLAAREQRTSEGIVESGFDQWLAGKRERGLYLEYDPDADFAALEARIGAGEAFPLADGA